MSSKIYLVFGTEMYYGRSFMRAYSTHEAAAAYVKEHREGATHPYDEYLILEGVVHQ